MASTVDREQIARRLASVICNIDPDTLVHPEHPRMPRTKGFVVAALSAPLWQFYLDAADAVLAMIEEVKNAA